MLYTVDRLEGEWVILEDDTGAMSQRLLAELPFPVAEGDKLEETGAGLVKREDERAAAMARNRALFERLRRRKGD